MSLERGTPDNFSTGTHDFSGVLQKDSLSYHLIDPNTVKSSDIVLNNSGILKSATIRLIIQGLYGYGRFRFEIDNEDIFNTIIEQYDYNHFSLDLGGSWEFSGFAPRNSSYIFELKKEFPFINTLKFYCNADYLSNILIYLDVSYYNFATG